MPVYLAIRFGHGVGWAYWRDWLVCRGYPLDYVDGLTFGEAWRIIEVAQLADKAHGDNTRRDAKRKRR